MKNKYFKASFNKKFELKELENLLLDRKESINDSFVYNFNSSISYFTPSSKTKFEFKKGK